MYSLDYEFGPFEGLLSAAEAAEVWGIDSSAIRKAIIDGRLIKGKDCRKFGKQWVITSKAMRRVFRNDGEPWANHLRILREEQLEESE